LTAIYFYNRRWAVHYTSVTEDDCDIFLQQKMGCALYFYNKSRPLHYGTEQEKGIAIGEVSTLQFCKRRKILFISTIAEGQCIIFL
jgi:hypothetical protein